MPSYLVTGSSRGLGLAYVEELLKNPDNYVIATARNPSKATELQTLISKHPKERAAIVQLDLADVKSIEKAAEEATKLLPEGLDCLLGNAGVSEQPTQSFENLNLEIINNTVLIRSFLPLIRKGKAGKFAFISSVIGSVELAATMPMLADAYSVSRAALNMLIRKWGAALKFEGIATAVIHPGMIILLFCCPPSRYDEHLIALGWVPATDIGNTIVEWVEKYAPNLPRVPVAESAAGVVKIIGTLTIEETNSFFSYDGSKLPW
ncbi:putative oxidoreductase [Hyphodiscus hymeniophilus]|uniref:Oxidoreductase n=1 Tax=Hyphodiscus hymeniophilus TaxID=353542 RepID=A0A9P6VQ12_9HELO|nr:putative oxidoreductase [Hyphodiscus hymeniophilus]